MPPADWYLLAGDETALPAIGRMLEDVPTTARVVVRIEVDSLADRQPLHSAAALDLQWLSREGRPAGTTALLAQATRGAARSGRRGSSLEPCQ
jgi:NADPH-dependent ferric siderophore reductase